ncbi:hypothetical protein L226DRAFT_526450 [Lentinus tigrinus ALCF2SS1-7]|uniref:uncharacterized protein n=1 Tax=Lentinus tigrinus ALCF2SS1-7 TaxID=1328758 RepID=UPI0011661679|nr:hypothetical protein L226DRAFT_526450 [Lentinus tigrinus ALCF2SS1-7]
MSMLVDDTFSFILNKPRRRVDNDASSFYFQMHPHRRRHCRGPSNMSVASNTPPTISLYNRSFSARAHRRNDSNTGVSSVAMSYAMHGAGGGHSERPRHNRDFSRDRAVGDKMFNVHSAPLSTISSSPERMYSEPEEVNRTSWDSIMDNTGRYTSVVDNSIFDKTDQQTSVSSESICGFAPSYVQYGRYMTSQQFRPLSIMSEMSFHSPVKEDDIMITCRRGTGTPHTRIVCWPPLKESPKKPRLSAQPSIASTSSMQFGANKRTREGRARARGTSHRRHIDEARMARSSVYETIEEEASVYSSSPSSQNSTPQSSAKKSSMNDTSVFVVNRSDRDSVCNVEWDDEHSITTLRRYEYALRDEAQVTDESASVPARIHPSRSLCCKLMMSTGPPTFRRACRHAGYARPFTEHVWSSSLGTPSSSRSVAHIVKGVPVPSQSYAFDCISREVARSTDACKPLTSAVHKPSVLREVWTANVNVPTLPPALLLVELETSEQDKNARGLPARLRVTSSTRRAVLVNARKDEEFMLKIVYFNKLRSTRHLSSGASSSAP